MKLWVQSSFLHSVVVHTSNLNTWDVKAGGTMIQGTLQLHSNIEACLVYCIPGKRAEGETLQLGVVASNPCTSELESGRWLPFYGQPRSTVICWLRTSLNLLLITLFTVSFLHWIVYSTIIKTTPILLTWEQLASSSVPGSWYTPRNCRLKGKLLFLH